MSHFLPRFDLGYIQDTILAYYWQDITSRKYSMIFFGIIIGVVIFAGMVYMAVNKKSNLITRLASLGAIALMLITVIICVIVVLSDKTVPIDPSTLIVGAPTEVKDEGGNSFAIIFTVVLIIALFVAIAVITMAEHKKNQPAKGSIIPDL
jgi:cytochrome bd-type quinol oxidase subunit 2